MGEEGEAGKDGEDLMANNSQPVDPDNAYYNDPNRPMASGDVASPSSYRPDQTPQSDRPLDKSA